MEMFVERSPSSPAQTTAKKNENTVLANAVDRVLKLRNKSGLWSLPVDLGTHCVSQYYLLLHFLGLARFSKLEVSQFRQQLLEEQLPDGSWYTVRDANGVRGELDPTVLNYWALKVLGESIDSPFMCAAREYVLSRGGIERTNFINKSLFALFGNYLWEDIPQVPYFLFSWFSPVHEKHFAKWVGAHTRPLAYLRKLNVTKDLGPTFNLDELWSSAVSLKRLKAGSKKEISDLSLNDFLFVEKLAKKQQPKGSWGGYTLSTLYSAAALEHAARNSKTLTVEYNARIKRAVDFIERRYIGDNPSHYQGAFMDGRLWDTVLLGQACIEGGTPSSELEKSAASCLQYQNKDGGFGFGEDFLESPDADCTAEAILFLRHFPKYQKQNAGALQWMIGRQNRDGGWGAFDVDNQGSPLLRKLVSGFSEIMDLFDPSSACVTGHVLEAMGVMGLHIGNSESARKGVEYLKQTQDSQGKWKGRWGVNYIYGSTAAIVGLIKAGIEPQEPCITRTIDWLRKVQNSDGGFGESVATYHDEKVAGRGISTPTQSAWVLYALLEAGYGQTQMAKRIAAYLTKEFSSRALWKDRSVVGCAQPGSVYMEYPSYPLAFSILALARYVKQTA